MERLNLLLEVVKALIKLYRLAPGEAKEGITLTNVAVTVLRTKDEHGNPVVFTNTFCSTMNFPSKPEVKKDE